MLKYVKHHLDTILGIEVFPVTSLLIFFLFFLVMLWFVFRMKKQEIEDVSTLPLHDSFSNDSTL